MLLKLFHGQSSGLISNDYDHMSTFMQDQGLGKIFISVFETYRSFPFMPFCYVLSKKRSTCSFRMNTLQVAKTDSR